MPLFRVTYERIEWTGEGPDDYETESGFLAASGWHDCDVGLIACDELAMSLREACLLVSPSHCSSSHPQPGDWFYSSPDIDYRTGAEEVRAIHPPHDITPSSMRRLARVLGITPSTY